ncbi:unnamed protein product [Cuscuta epithymum]|nr:unnamed protein product [Cuscuta epithymum]
MFDIDADELCWFWLEELAKKCGDYCTIDAIYYMVPNVTYEEGLRRAYHDDQVRDMITLVLKTKCIDCYVIHGIDVPDLIEAIEYVGPSVGGEIISSNNKNKLTPKGGSKGKGKGVTDEISSTSLQQTARKKNNDKEECVCTQHLTTDSEAFESDRPHSPFTWDGEEESSDPEYTPATEEEQINVESSDLEGHISNDEDIENIEEGLFGSEEDTSDEEYQRVREGVKGWNAKVMGIANTLQKEAAEGKLPGQSHRTSMTHVHEHKDKESAFTSDYEDTDEEMLTPDKDEEQYQLKKKMRERIPVVNEHTDYNILEWKVGTRFESREKFRDAVVRFAVAQGRNLMFSVSDKKRQQRLGAKCVPGCPFRIYASWDSRRGSFVVKSVVGAHMCHRNMEANKQLKSSWVAQQFLEVFKSRPHWPAREIIETVRRAYRVVVKKNFAYKVKYIAHRKLHGSMKDHYNKLGRYLEALALASPASHFKLEVNPELRVFPPVFQRLFVCFDGVKQGWLQGCRKVMCVDGCFLKTFLGGVLLAAVGRDANEQMYPLAWAVVEGENNDSWEWFFIQLNKSIGETDGSELTIISDEHRAILNGVQKVIPRAEHRHCARHIYANWHKNHKGDELKMAFWKIAKAYNEADYYDALTEMEQLSPTATQAFKAYDPKRFCRSFIQTKTKCDVIVNNMAETFNGYILNARTKHLIFMMEDIRTALMQRIVQKKQQMEVSHHFICPRIQAKLEKEKEEAANCAAMPSSLMVFQVSHRMDSVTVDLTSKTCTCRKWELTGVPCCHSIACMFFLHHAPEEYVHDYYKKDTYMKAYNGFIPPCSGERHWPRKELPLDPPPIKIGPGRPRKNRRKDPHEDPKRPGKLTKHGMEMTCSICKSKQHNKRKCPDKDKTTSSSVQNQVKKPRGRPRKHVIPSVETERQTEYGNVTAQPTQTGRGGRVIMRGRGRGRGRGKGTQVPQGFGVFIDGQGNSILNSPGQIGGPRVISGSGCPPSSNVSAPV